MSATSVPPSSGKSPLKIILIVLGVLFLLCAGCCGVGFYAAYQIGKGFPNLQMAIQGKHGQAATFQLAPSGPQQNEVILALGLTETPAPEKRAELEDWIWTTYVDAFQGGAIPVKGVVVGKARGPSNVSYEDADVVPVGEIERRTGKTAPPLPWWLPKDALKDNRVKVTVDTTPDDETKDEKPSDDAK